MWLTLLARSIYFCSNQILQFSVGTLNAHAYILQYCNGAFDLSDKLYRLRFDEAVNPQLVAYFLSLFVVRQQIEIEATGASHSMQNIGQSTIKEMPVVIPPIEEANELVSTIKEQMTVFEALESKAVKGIKLLQERRTALISAAVTGKIDVRRYASHPTGGLQPSKSSVHVAR